MPVTQFSFFSAAALLAGIAVFSFVCCELPFRKGFQFVSNYSVVVLKNEPKGLHLFVSNIKFDQQSDDRLVTVQPKSTASGSYFVMAAADASSGMTRGSPLKNGTVVTLFNAEANCFVSINANSQSPVSKQPRVACTAAAAHKSLFVVECLGPNKQQLHREQSFRLKCRQSGLYLCVAPTRQLPVQELSEHREVYGSKLATNDAVFRATDGLYPEGTGI